MLAIHKKNKMFKSTGLAILIIILQTIVHANNVPIAAGGISVDILRSRDCTRDCIDQGNVFCRGWFEFNKGNCCDPNDTRCLYGQLEFCSNSFDLDGMKLFTCPFEG